MRYKEFIYMPLIREPHLPPYPDRQSYPGGHEGYEQHKQARLARERLQNNDPWTCGIWKLTYWRDGPDVYLECGAWGFIKTPDYHMTNRLMGPGAWSKKHRKDISDQELECWGLK